MTLTHYEAIIAYTRDLPATPGPRTFDYIAAAPSASSYPIRATSYAEAQTKAHSAFFLGGWCADNTVSRIKKVSHG